MPACCSGCLVWFLFAVLSAISAASSSHKCKATCPPYASVTPDAVYNVVDSRLAADQACSSHSHISVDCMLQHVGHPTCCCMNMVMSIASNCHQSTLPSASTASTHFVTFIFHCTVSLLADRSVLIPSGDDGQHLQVNGGVPALKKRTGNNSTTRSGSKSGEACPLLFCNPVLFFLAASLSSSFLQAYRLLLGCKPVFFFLAASLSSSSWL